MPWNWELPNWPQFDYDPGVLNTLERQFLLEVGGGIAYLKETEGEDYKRFVIEILSSEGIGSSRIEGEILDRESLQSSIKKHFGLQTPSRRISDKESGMAALICDVYESFDEPLTHEMLWRWHSLLFAKWGGSYRAHPEPMQIVSNRYGSSKVFFEAPPSERVFAEMDAFINWFNRTRGTGSVFGRAAMAHVYFESIHPFEDGNGRIGRILIEKILSQEIQRPVLIAISKLLEKRKKEYYAALERCNCTLEIGDWVRFLSDVIVQAQQESMELLYFFIEKSKLLNALADQLNSRQTKVLLRLFAEGPEGFKGGLSAENYIAITKTTRATATRDLADLVEKGALIKTGELRYTRYQLNIPTYKKS